MITEQIEALKLPIGAKPGQVVLLVDLSEVPRPSQVLELVTSLGFNPQLRYCEFRTGLHVVALLKEEQLDPTKPISDEYLAEEWETLVNQINPDAVHLWRGQPRNLAQTEDIAA
ncbi:hypothetical protein NDA01_30885 [Trichocoleus desertorum AS-A10]|uniref:hypothetical protein n=1 Tax=Trichocoleus desertorum TaxID=1481672 RepID=UPI003296F698